MERIELFERYIFERLTPREKNDFETRLKSDKDFAADFKIYIFSLKGILQEAELDDLELTHAFKNLTRDQICKATGKKERRLLPWIHYWQERIVWISSVAAILISGIFIVLHFEQRAQYRLYDTIVAYNYIPNYDRSEGDIYNYTEKESKDLLPLLERDYREAPANDIQYTQDAGMRLAMLYLKLHDKKKALEILKELASRFRNDEDFASRCNKIISQLE